MNLQDKIIKAVEQNELLYRENKISLYDAIDNCYDDVINVSKGNAFIFAEDDDDTENLFKDDTVHRLNDLIGKTITIKGLIKVSIGGIYLYILITKEKYVLG